MENIRFNLFLNTAPATIVVKPDAPHFTIITANNAYLEATGTTLSELIGKGFLEAFPENPTHQDENNVSLLKNSLLAAVASKQRTVMEGHRYDIFDRHTGNWETRYWTNTNSPVVNEAGEIECIVHITHDITDSYLRSKQEKSAFTNAEMQRKQLLNAYRQAPVGIGLLSGKNLKIVFGNDSILNVLGKTNDIIGSTVAEAIPELMGQPFLQILDHVYAGGETYYGNNMPAHFQKDGHMQEGFYNFIYHPLKSEDGNSTGIMVIGIDVTEQVMVRKELEKNIEQKNKIAEALRNNERRLRGILDTMAEGVSIYDRNGEVVYINSMALKITGIPEDEFAIQNYNDNKWQSRRPDGSLIPKEEQPVMQVLSTQKPVYDKELYLTLPGNDYKYISVNATPLFDNQNQFTGCIATFTDVTHRRKLLDQLAESESLFRGIFEQAPLGMCMLRGRDQVIEAVNDNILTIWGRTREEVIGRPQRIARPELEGQSIIEWLDEVFTTGKTRMNIDLKVKLNNPAGGTKDVIVNSVYQPITDAGGSVTGVLMITNEITKQYKERLQAAHTQEMFKLAVESTDLGTWYYDIDTDEFVASSRAKELYGYRADETVAYEKTFFQVHEDYRNSVKKTILSAYNQGESYDLEYPVAGYHDKQLRWVKSTGKLYPSHDGKRGQFSGTLLDITERKRDEIRKNDFIAMVSHELKTPLTSMKSSLQVLRMVSYGQGEESRFMLDKADQQINKMTNLINSFLNVARLDAGKIYLEKTDFLIDALIREIIEDMSFVTKDHIVSFLPCEPTLICADSEKIGQVINNFISNAVKYSPRRTRISIDCKRVHEGIYISVADEGKGISQGDIEKLFDRFYRVENKDNTTISGFGIGLYVCSEIIQRHNGTIGVKSQEGAGSVFYFTLPAEQGSD